MRLLILSFALSALGLGCATIPQKGGFDDVQEMSAKRGIQRIHWNQGTDADETVEQAIVQLLTRELKAAEAVQIALLKNPTLQATYEDLAVAQADLVQAGLLKNPVFNGEFRIQEGSGHLLFEGTLMTQFIDLFLIPLRKSIAQAEFEAAKHRVTRAVVELAGQTRSAFYRVQANRQLLEMRRTVVASLDASVEVARRMRKAGNITELDLADQQAQLEQARVDLMAAQWQVDRERERLARIMGIAGTVQWQMADRLDDPPQQEPLLEDAEARAIERSLLLGAQRQRIVASAKRLGLSQPLATLLDGEIGATAEHTAEEGWAIGPAVSVPLPLFDQGQARVAKAQAELRRARQTYHARELETRGAARQAVIHLQAARKMALHYRDVILPLSKSVIEQTQLQYNAMQLGVSRLLAARREQIEAGAQYVQSLRDYWLARSDLEQIVNGALPRDESAERQEGAGDAGDVP